MVRLKINDPSISVIMSVYNDSQYLGEAIESILYQTYSNFEFLIADDASMDSSVEIIQAYAKNDGRISYFGRKENVGLAKNLNFLLGKAKGQFIARMDGDDVSLPERFEREIDLITVQDLDLVWCNVLYIDEAGNEICERYQPSVEQTLARLGRQNYIVHPATMFRRETVLALGGYDEAYQTGQDGKLWLSMKERACRFGVVYEPLMKYRIEPNSITSKRTSYGGDMNFVHAKLCLVNRQRKKSLKYIWSVKNPLQKLYLVIRWLVGENIVEFLKQFKRYDYDAVHKKSS